MIRVKFIAPSFIMYNSEHEPLWYANKVLSAQLEFDTLEEFTSRVVGRLQPNRACYVILPNYNNTGYSVELHAVYDGYEEVIDAD